MKNKEKFVKEIVDIACSGCRFGVNKRTGEITSCNYILCRNCVFHNNADCSEAKREWAESEYIEKPVISKRDRAFLGYIDKRYEYLTRDKTDKLYVHREKPYKDDIFWTNAGRCFCLNDRINVDFPMVKWSDDKPWLIEDLKKLEVVDEYD